MTDQRYMRPGLEFAVGKAVEEAGEFLAAIGKTLRWGWASTNPELPPEQRETNAAWVMREMADLRGALDNLEREMLVAVPTPAVQQAVEALRQHNCHDTSCERIDAALSALLAEGEGR